MITEQNPWKDAVIDELVSCCIYNSSHDDNPRKALHDALSWNVEVALDPQVSSDADDLITKGAEKERNEILMICECIDHPIAKVISQAIRAKAMKIDSSVYIDTELGDIIPI